MSSLNEREESDNEPISQEQINLMQDLPYQDGGLYAKSPIKEKLEAEADEQ